MKRLGEDYKTSGYKSIDQAIKEIEQYLWGTDITNPSVKIEEIPYMPNTYQFEYITKAGKIFMGRRAALKIGFADRNTGKLKSGYLLKRKDIESMLYAPNSDKSQYIKSLISGGEAYVLFYSEKLKEYRLGKIIEENGIYKLFVDGEGERILDYHTLGRISDHPKQRLKDYKY
ncbi:hypothetical protein YN1_8260 [Nanoarchaeota archaeon]